MIIGVPKETAAGESRVALLPASAEKLIKRGATVQIETGLAASIGISDADYSKVGVEIKDRNTVLSSSDMLIRVKKPALEEISKFKKGCLHISFLDPFNEGALLQAFAESGVSAISMEMIPRTTLAQKMDVLSSQANLAGYVSVILAAEQSDKVFPMMMTPAGTITPSRVFVIGAGVAGLQAIATARRLGARVDAFDTRPVVEEQVQSLGGKFVKIDLGETGQTKDGYAKALTPEQLEKQKQGMLKVCQQSDVIITTAQLFGRKAPVVISKAMIEQIRPGTVIVDMAVESGGNVEGSVLGQVTNVGGVKIIGFGNLPSRVAANASQVYSNNLESLIAHFWDAEKKSFKFNLEDEILKGCLITHQGAIVNETLKGKK